MENNRELLLKQFHFYFDQIKSIISKKDRFFADFNLIFQRIKEIKELSDHDSKLFMEMIINFLKTSNMRIFEKCIDCIEKIISHNLIEYCTFPDLTTNILNYLFDKSSQNDDGVNFKILNICLILNNSELFCPMGANILLMIRICLFIFLTSLNQTCQNIAKITLIQIMDYFLEKCKNSLKRDNNVEIIDHNSYLDLSKYIKQYIDIIDISLNEKNKNIDILSKFIKINCAENDNNEENIDEIYESTLNTEIKNEFEYINGKYGWCYNCRKTANLFSKKIKFPICSKNCEFLVSHDRMIQQHISYKEDFINVFKSLSILSIKDLKDNSKVEKINIKLREFCLELMYKNLVTCGKYYISNNELIQVIREYTIDSLVKNCLSGEVNTCKIALALFHLIMKYYREQLRDQIDIFITNVLIYIIDSENFGFMFKDIVLDTLTQFNDNSYFFIELFSNFDCEINHKNIFKELLSLLCKIIQKHYYKPKYDSTFFENERTILKTKCFNFIIDLIKNLDNFIVERSNFRINEINNNLKQPLLEEDEKEARESIFIKEKITQNRKIKSIIEKGIEKFNIKPYKGIEFLRNNDIFPSQETYEKLKANELDNDSKLLNYQILYDKNFFLNCDYEDFFAREISKFLKNNKDIKKPKVGEYLCLNLCLNKKCLYYYIDQFNFKDLHILDAMRIFFSDFYLLGEGQIVDRIMQHFGQKYHKDNPNIFSNPDIGYYLSFSIIMLQTDLHRPEILTKMSPETFCERVIQLTKSEMSADFLNDIYNKIQNEPIKVSGIDENFKIMMKNKKEIDSQNEKIFKNTILELKRQSTSMIFFTNIDNYHVRDLLESCWSFFLGIFSVISNEVDDENVFLNCIESILLIGKMCSILRLDTISEAFFNTVIKMTNIMEAKEIKLKNIDCIRLLIEFVVQYGPLIRTSWYNILSIISNIEYYQTIGGQFKNEGELFEKEVRRRSKIKNPDLEIGIELKNTESICKNISQIFCDNVFSRTANFDEEGIVCFVSALCKLSVTELSRFYTPRNYSLHKLIEVADYNIYRIQIEWTKIWRLISQHIIYVVNNFPHDIICIDAIDSLRQIVLKLLQKSDLAIYNFQIEFFDPFETIFTHTVSKYDRSESIITCLSYITQNAKNIHSGWVTIFSILKFALKRRYFSIHYQIICIIETVNEDNILNNFSQEVFKAYIECLCHMYLEDNMKEISTEILTRFLNKVIIHYDLKINPTKQIEYLKNFFFSLDDLMKFNIDEYLNLVFFLFNKTLLLVDFQIINYIYVSLILPQIICAALTNFDDSIYMLMKLSDKINLKYICLNIIEEGEDLNKFSNKYFQKTIENFLIKINCTDWIIKKDESYHKKYLDYFDNINIQTYEKYLNKIVDKMFVISGKFIVFVEHIVVHLYNLSCYTMNFEFIHKIILDKIERYGIFFSKDFWNEINTINLFIFDCFTKLNEQEFDFIFVKYLMNFFLSFLKVFYFLLTNYFDSIILNSEGEDSISNTYKHLNIVFYNILCIEIQNKDSLYKISEDANSIEILNYLLKIKVIIIEHKHDANNIFDEYIIKSIECYNKIFLTNNLCEEESNEIINIITFELNNLVPKYINYLSAEHVSRLFLYIIDFIDARNIKIRKSVKKLIEQLVSNQLITFSK